MIAAPSKPAQHDPGAFDGEALRPYNAGPDALLLNYKAVSFYFIADHESKQARVYALPALAGLVTPPTVRGSDGPCNDWRARLGGDFSDPLRPMFRGAYPLSCGDKVWHVSDARHGSIRRGDISLDCGMSSGGVWRGRVREGVVPPDARRLAQHESRPLAEVDPRHQQVQQQRDGAAVVPDTGQRGEPAAGKQGARAARSRRLAC